MMGTAPAGQAAMEETDEREVDDALERDDLDASGTHSILQASMVE